MGGIKLKEKVKMEMEVREKEGKTTSFMVSVHGEARERVSHASSTTDRSLASPLHAPPPQAAQQKIKQTREVLAFEKVS